MVVPCDLERKCLDLIGIVMRKVVNHLFGLLLIWLCFVTWRTNVFVLIGIVTRRVKC